ncbi:MAG TPA: sn-glycerol-3-phosphate ABC transporter ATP-binding protein UgpC [Actinomycetota bacterium]|nr:sn-glycerol-3-phosphate ABC transporter ATP-binding protein UgpC [Actinomycetota bacterium]
MAEIVFEDMTKVYDDGTVAVRNLDLEVEDGSLMVFVGPSGCGKTTALRAVAGLEDITAGTVRIGDRVVNDIAPKERDIAMVFQNYALYPHLSVFENMAFSLRMRHHKKPDVNTRVERTAKMLALFDLLTRKPGQLSGGQRQRVAMGRAIVRQPKAFLMDEPLSNLDAKLRVQMRAEISRLQREVSVTTIYVTHDQVEAMTMGDRVAVLKLGVLQQVAPPSELYRRPANLFVAGFIGSPAMNMVEATLRRDDDGLALEFGGYRLAIDDSVSARRPALASYVDRPVIVGIRPEDMEDAALTPGAPENRRLSTKVELREDMGAEVFVHFAVDCPPVLTEDTKELAADRGLDVEELAGAGARTTSFVARFDADTNASEDDRVEVLVDTAALHFFDRDTGLSIWDEVPSRETSAAVSA